MRLFCFSCEKPVSNLIPDDVVFRATATCPECEDMKPRVDEKPFTQVVERLVAAQQRKEREDEFVWKGLAHYEEQRVKTIARIGYTLAAAIGLIGVAFFLNGLATLLKAMGH